MNYDPIAGRVAFEILVNETKVLCYISIEALEDHFDAGHLGGVKAFQRARWQIETRAKERFTAGYVDADGTVRLTTLMFPS